MNLPTPRHALALFSLLAFSLAGCADNSYDVHDAPRETQDWETVNLTGKDSQQLLAHLQTLANTAQTAALAGAYVEFHHLEVAMTPALEALAAQVADKPAATATIETLKPLAIKLHHAGHEANISQGAKLSDAIAKLLTQLESQL